jgi:hypothetical protein
VIIGPPPRRFDELSARFVDERPFGLVGVLTSAIAATSVAAERTKAEQCTGDQVEQIRRKAYDSVGLDFSKFLVSLVTSNGRRRWAAST